MQIPASTYRIQFNREFTFQDLDKILAYLHALGVSTVYASPIVTAVPGSMHGYDVTDPHRINPEIGSIEQLNTLAARLRQYNMVWLQDIVPNHMAFDGHNFRLMDVLERGEHSPYYNYFDIDWDHPSTTLNGKVMVPFLGDDAQVCIERGELKLMFSSVGFCIAYMESYYPLSLSAYSQLHALSVEHAGGESIQPDFAVLIRDAELPHTEWQASKRAVMEGILKDKTKQAVATALVNQINEDADMLARLLQQQYYVLTNWRVTTRMINYRRFFTVNSLICLRMEDEAVFNEYHTFLRELYDKDLLQGLRIDHIDGLNDPLAYIQRLRETFGTNCYIIAEKILEAREDMPAYWPLEGSSGYEFLSYVSRLFTDREGVPRLTSIYHSLVPGVRPYDNMVADNKKLILEEHMGGEWDNLVDYFFMLGLGDQFSRAAMKQGLAAIMQALPVYRIYPEAIPVTGRNLQRLREAFSRAPRLHPETHDVLDHLRTLFTTAPADAERGDIILRFLRRMMQFTGPLTAKGVEDTTFYVYNALISHDEVGDAPSTLAITIEEFHSKMQNRQRLSPLSLNATATHDTKRGEDARVRLNVLSELPDKWQEHVSRWYTLNQVFRQDLDGRMAPDANDEYFIYQSIVGGFPEDLIVSAQWVERLQAYMLKAMREAKVNSSWDKPDERYETACTEFITHILTEQSPFLNDLMPFLKLILLYSQQYALGQAMIKMTAPGIPDIYQGCELWDLSYVDPDNRRPVDYIKRIEYLQEIMTKEQEGPESLFLYLRDRRQEGFEKLFVTWKTLNFRKAYPDVFIHGSYLPLSTYDADSNVVAYARHYQDQWVIIVVPLGLAKRDASGFGREWEHDHVILPEHAPRTWENRLTGEVITGEGRLCLSVLFKTLPVALLRG